MIHDYESWGVLSQRTSLCIPEAIQGVQAVQWAGNIERQLGRLLDDAEKGRNWPYADKVREFLKIWRANEITGSINRETIEVLKSASDVLSVDSWNLKNYFSNLRDQLRKLIAAEEELPRDMDQDASDPMQGGGGGGGRGAPPMAPSFGPQDEPPGGAAPGVGKPGDDTGKPPDLEGKPAPDENAEPGDLEGGPPDEEDLNKPQQ